MKLKDIQIGQSYFYEDSKSLSASMVFVLDISTTLRTTSTSWDGRNKALFKEHRKGDYKPDGTRVGYLALKVNGSNADRLTPDQLAALSAITASQVALNDYKFPAHLREMGIRAHLVLIQTRYVVGDWTEIRQERKAAQRLTEERERERKQAAEKRIERWEAVVDAIGKLKGAEGHGYYVSEFGEGERKEIELEDMEMLIGLAKQVLPNLFENEPAV